MFLLKCGGLQVIIVINHFVNESGLLALATDLSGLSDGRHWLYWLLTEGQYF